MTTPHRSPVLRALPLCAVLYALPSHAVRLDEASSDGWLTLDRMTAICARHIELATSLCPSNELQSDNRTCIAADGQGTAEGTRGAAKAKANPAEDAATRRVLDTCDGEADARPSLGDWQVAAGRAFPQWQAADGARAATAPGVWAGSAGWQAAFLEGLTAFVIERARSELVLAFGRTLSEKICAADAVKWFENTCAVLKPMTEEDATTVYAETLRAALAADLDRWARRAMGASCGAAVLGAAAVEVAHRIERGADPVALLAGLATARFGACEKSPMARALRTLGQWVPYMAPSGEIGDPALRRRLLIALAETLKTTPARLRSLGYRLEATRKALEGFSTAEDGKRAEAFLVYLERALDVLELAIDMYADGQGETAGASDADIATARSLLDHTRSALTATRRHDYPAVVTHALAIQRALGADGPAAPAAVARYAGFAAALAGARTPDEMSAALENAAVPVGSFRHKRSDGVTLLGVNAYLGAGIGGEWLGGAGAPDGASGHVGLSLPIGLELSRGFGKSSLSALVSIIDVGTIADVQFEQSYEVEDGETVSGDHTPAWTFEQVLAPGIWGVVGITGSVPLSLGFGASLVPGLREVTTGTDGETVGRSSTRAFPAFRVGVFVAVDVPIVQF